MDIVRIHEKLFKECQGKIGTDSRTIIPGGMFIALKGEHFDGNDFALGALELGFAYALVDRESLAGNPGIIYVPDVLSTIQDLARFHRRTFDIPIIAITGSNGKTTTKELIKASVEGQLRVVATEGNLNNHIGVPLTLLQISKETEVAIIEMGANHEGEIGILAAIAEPTHGVITNIGRAHLGYFGSIDAIAKTKGELFEFLRTHNGKVFVNKSDERLMVMSCGMDRVCYGTATEGPYRVSLQHLDPYLSLTWNHHGLIQTHLTGKYNLDNIACALSVATELGVRPLVIIKGLTSYRPHNNRSEIYHAPNENVIIKDFYNANTNSMNLAIENARVITPGAKLTLILGDMFELGDFAEAEHRAVVETALSVNPSELILVGSIFSKVADARALSFLKTEDLVSFLKEHPLEHRTILIKGSRGMHLEQVFEVLS